jgi:UDP-glucose 4-epimerase
MFRKPSKYQALKPLKNKFMKILVTGGAGFIGSHTVVALAQAGFEPIIVDNFANAEKSTLLGIENILGKTIKYYQENCLDRRTVRLILNNEKAQGVIHFAAHKAVGESVKKPLDYYENNLFSLISVLKAMITEGVENIIFSSSATVYGLAKEMPVTEDMPVQAAMSPYGNTKQIGEEILQDIVQSEANIKAIALRYFNPIGAHPTGLIGELPLGVPNNLVPFITQTAAKVRPKLTVFGNDYPTPDGTCLRDYIHVMDLAEAHVLALKHLLGIKKPCFYDVFNVGTGKPNSVQEVISTFQNISKTTLNYEIGERRLGDVPALYADVSKIKQQLNWEAKRSMPEALEDAWRWQLQLGQN